MTVPQPGEKGAAESSHQCKCPLNWGVESTNPGRATAARTGVLPAAASPELPLSQTRAEGPGEQGGVRRTLADTLDTPTAPGPSRKPGSPVGGQSQLEELGVRRQGQGGGQPGYYPERKQ